MAVLVAMGSVAAPAVSPIGSPLAPQAADAAPGTPGTPQGGVPFYEEDFQNQTVTGAAIPIQSYVGAAAAQNQTYTADPQWLPTANRCNGWVLNSQSPKPATDNGCQVPPAGTSWLSLQFLADVLAQHQGLTGNARTFNQVLAEYTHLGNPGPGVELRTNTQMAAQAGRYYAISAMYAAVSCGASDPSLTFRLIINGTPTTLGTGLNPCTDPARTVYNGIVNGNPTPASVADLRTEAIRMPLTGNPTLGIELYNANGNGSGNDTAFDVPRILDITPQLDKEFVPGTIASGGTSDLVFTVTNTEDLLAKEGWTFTDALPAGVTATGVNSTDCPDGTVTAAAGSTNVSAGGDLADGQESCTVTVQITATTPGTYINGPRNVTVSGLNPPGDTPLEVVTPRIAIDKVADQPVDANGNTIIDAGDTIQYRFTVTNTGPITLHDVTVTDDIAGPVTCTSTTLAPGASTPCVAVDPYTITPADIAAGAVDNTAFSTGTPPTGPPVNSPPDSTRTQFAPIVPHISLEKTAGTPVDVNGNGLTDVGDTIQYTFVVTNDGDAPLTNVAVTDDKAGAVTCEKTTLAVGEEMDCEADAVYVITADDADDEEVHNVATATGKPPTGPDVTDTDETRTEVELAPAAIELEKTAGTPVDVNGNGRTDAGDTIQYTFVVTNVGLVPLTNVAVTDDKAGAVSCEKTTLAVGEEMDCEADAVYVITADDVDDEEVHNIATATGKPPTGPDVTDTDETRTEVDPPPGHAELRLDKRAATPVDVNDNDITDAGDTIQYTFVVTNTGDVAITDLEIEDDLAGPASCAATSLAVGASTTCTAVDVYVITPADVTAGAVENIAIAHGTDPEGTPVDSNPDETRTPTQGIVPLPRLLLEKFAADPVDVNHSGLPDAGDTIQYTFKVTNTGNVAITDLEIDDDIAGAVTCLATTLAVDASTTCKADAVYTITEADETRGHVDNVAFATGTDPTGGPVRSNPDDTRTPVADPDPQLRIDKYAGTPVDVNGNKLTDAGDTILFTFTVTNTGNVPLTNIVVDDPKAGPVTCAATSLAVRASTGCRANAPYVVTEADVDAGMVENVATATGTPPTGPPKTSPPDDTETPTDRPKPSLILSKFAGLPLDLNGSGLTDAGDTIQYSFKVTNNGNVTVTDVVVDDDKAGPVTCDDTVLEVGESTMCSADDPYVITVADEGRGRADNVAIAHGKDPVGGPVDSNEDETTTPVAKPNPRLALDKTAGIPTDVNDNDRTDAGDTIEFTFVVTNTGNVPLHDLEIADDMVGSVTCDATELDPGESTDCAADELYVITEADEDAGVVHNVATATAKDPNDDPVPPGKDDTKTPVDDDEPKLNLVKIAGTPVDVNDNDRTDAGDTIQYTFVVTNNGNVPLTAIEVVDTKAGSVTCERTSLAVGQSTKCTADEVYVITAADVAEGLVRNVAHATGKDPEGNEVPSPPDEEETPTDPPAAALTIDKEAKQATFAKVGDVIDYTFLVTNTGDVTLTDIVVVDPKLDAPATCPDTTLDPGEATTCTGTHTVTAADVEAGEVRNVAHATGKDPEGDPVPSPPDTEVVPPVATEPKLELEKEAGVPSFAEVGDVIPYTFTVTNVGDVVITDLVIDDDKLDADAVCEDTTLDPDEETTCTGDHTVTAEDMTAGEVVNTATATGTDPEGAPVTSNPDTATVPGPEAVARLDLVKEAEVTEVSKAGDVIPYTFTVTNSGTLVVEDIVVEDDRVDAPVVCPKTTLAPGESMTCTGSHTVTEADIAAGEIVNVAVVTGNPVCPDEEPDDRMVRVADTGSTTTTEAVDECDETKSPPSKVRTPVKVEVLPQPPITNPSTPNPPNTPNTPSNPSNPGSSVPGVSSLPRTGGPIALLALLGLGLVGGGASTTLGSLRRRRRPGQDWNRTR